jgi:hypothetical protein
MPSDEDADTGAETQVRTVPYERLQAVTRAKAEAEARAAELEARVAELTPASKRVETLAAQLADYERRAAAWTEERAILAAGISDPDGVDIARHAWSRVPADQRPEGGLPAWLQSRDSLPRGVQAYMPAVAAAPADPAPPPSPRLPAANTGAAPAVPHGGARFTAAHIDQMSDAEWAAQKSAIIADVLGRR